MLVEAKQRWERIIMEDRWGPWPKSFLEHPLVEVATAVPNGVDDLYVAVVVGNIDGSGSRYAEAGQTLMQTGGRIIAGSIKIDTNDIPTILDKNIFDWVRPTRSFRQYFREFTNLFAELLRLKQLMLHELGHVLGIGTMWDAFVDGSSYIGTNGLKAWRDMGCTGDLPLNTRDTGHWNENCLAKELMTPTLKWNQDQHLSAITLGALEDQGWVVNHAEKDYFGLENLGDCGDFCPAAGKIRRRLGSPGRDQDLDPSPQLSQKAEMELMQAAADRFRAQERRLQKYLGDDLEFSPGRAFSYVYEENGHTFSKTIHRRQVEHLL